VTFDVPASDGGRMLTTFMTLMAAMTRCGSAPSAEHRMLAKLTQLQPCRARDLADALGLDHTTVSRHLAGLTRRGLAGVTVGADRRARMVTVTDAGAAHLRDYFAVRAAQLDQALQTLPADRREQFLTAYADVAAALAGQHDPA
jgi:DNA-binding MarR family transcriptional regulator